MKTISNKFMSFTFRGSNIDNPMSKYIIIEQCIPILELISASHIWLRYSSLIKKFIRYIKESGIKGIKRDEWDNIFYFFKQNPDDLSNYAQDDAWPMIFDDFAEYIMSKGSK